MKKILITVKRIKNPIGDETYKLTKLVNAVACWAGGGAPIRVGDPMNEAQVEKLIQDNRNVVTVTE